VCATPVDGYPRCYKCNSLIAPGRRLANIVAPITYAVTETQAMHDLYVYKDPRYSAEVMAGAQNRLFTMLFESLSRHLSCFVAHGGGPLVVATVPSSGPRSEPHPLTAALGMFSAFDQATISYVGPPNLDRMARRVFAPERFSANRSEVLDRHVLLIDDAWVTGAHVQSCAAALHAAGATYVSAIPLGRVLDQSRTETATYLRDHRQREFDPDICPITGLLH
jgi:hypothetical protein